MTDQNVRALVTELIEASPPPPAFHELTTVQAGPRSGLRRSARCAVVLLAVACVAGGVILVVHRPRHRQILRATSPTTVSTTRRSTPASPAPPPAPIYTDPSNPPPLRLSAGGRTVVVTTGLGCWFTHPPTGFGHGRCADGPANPYQFHLDLGPGSHVLLTSPIAATVQASTAFMPTRPSNPHMMPGPLTHVAPVAVRQIGPMSWDITVPTYRTRRALLINLRAATTVRGIGVSGNGEYSLELRPTNR